MSTPEKPTPENPSVEDRFARQIVGMGLGVPAIFWLEMARPLSVVNASMMLAAQPFVTAFWPVPQEDYRQLCDTIGDRERLEDLILRIEDSLAADDTPIPPGEPDNGQSAPRD